MRLERAVSQLDSLELLAADPITVVVSVVALYFGDMKGLWFKINLLTFAIFLQKYSLLLIWGWLRGKRKTLYAYKSGVKGLHKTVLSKCFCSFASGASSFKIKSYTNRATSSCERCSEGRVSQTAEEKGKFHESQSKGKTNSVTGAGTHFKYLVKHLVSCCLISHQ